VGIDRLVPHAVENRYIVKQLLILKSQISNRQATINSQISNLKSADLDWKHPGYKPSVQPVNQQKNLVSDQRTDLCLRRFRVTSILQFF